MRNSNEFLIFYSILICNKHIGIMTEEKFKDIVKTMVEYGLMDPYKAMLDQNYLINCINIYVESANIARKMMNMEPLL